MSQQAKPETMALAQHLGRALADLEVAVEKADAMPPDAAEALEAWVKVQTTARGVVRIMRAMGTTEGLR